MAASAVVFQGPEAWPKLKRGGKLSGPEQLVKVGNGELDGVDECSRLGWMFFQGRIFVENDQGR